VKMGAKGVLLATTNDSGCISFEVFPALTASVINVIGAGDNLVAGILYGLSKRKTLRESIRFGLAVAKTCVESVYAVNPNLNEKVMGDTNTNFIYY